MRSRSFISLILPAFVLAAAACAPAAPAPVLPTLLDQPAAVATSEPAATAAPSMPQPTEASQPSAEAQPTGAALSFTPALYDASAAGYQLEYPSDWTAVPVTESGSRASQGELFSPGSSADGLAEGGTRMAMTVYEWDPKSNLPAFVDQRRAAWQSSGFSIVKDASGTLANGNPFASFVIQTPDNHQAFFLFTTLGEKYLEISGEGNLALAEEIARTVK
jgi:hypothetical protein